MTGRTILQRMRSHRRTGSHDISAIFAGIKKKKEKREKEKKDCEKYGKKIANCI